MGNNPDGGRKEFPLIKSIIDLDVKRVLFFLTL